MVKSWILLKTYGKHKEVLGAKTFKDIKSLKEDILDWLNILVLIIFDAFNMINEEKVYSWV